MCSDFSLNKSAVRTKNCSLNMPADQHNFMSTDGLELKMPNGWRTKSLVHKFRLHSRRGKGMAESFSRKKLRHAPQKEGGWEILCDPGWYVQRTWCPEWMGRKHTHTTHCMFWCPYMVSVQCDGGLLPDIILLTLCDSIGEPFECHVEFLSLQPLFPPKPFD